MKRQRGSGLPICLCLAACISVCATAETPLVTCGSVIKLQHERSHGLLHSHEISYGSGSGQQSVTANFEANDANSFWIVRPPKDTECPQGTPFNSGGLLRLQHAVTQRWLHSHNFRSPLTANQEISAFGDPDNSDDGDVWAVSWDGSTAQWQQDQRVKLKHVQTGVFLAASDRKYSRPISGQQEVCGKGKAELWLAGEGVFFPPREES